MPMTDEEKEAKARNIVALWSIDLWIEKPEWLSKMPDKAAIERLIGLIARHL